ncbi:hypothetical protein GOARA_011_00300 [Gordonia araii NBRC 100433]|uniref:Uncharacterized protein n=1 Tax=Gordonia araii NBRC 100433 TaxID=1073574 RepID=G7GXT9_9ACTN|nr:hypothetical protein [Gordonia araii]NNG98390.1 acetyltransferase [Gordonia araii NBRC 100433]GAB08414.1 hypothetical protein GOARA_011_00300 [Gordonia araii NBRC 100433]
MIYVMEHAIANYGSVATLRASTPELDFVPPLAWYYLGVEEAHRYMASRVLLRSSDPPPPFVPNVAIQYFSLGITEVIRVGELDTTMDLQALGAEVVDHEVGRDGYLCVDSGTYSADGQDLQVRRSQLTYSVPGDSMLAVFTATATVDEWGAVELEISTMEDSWLAVTIPTSGSD